MLFFQRNKIPNLSAGTANLRRICWLRGVLIFAEYPVLMLASVLLQFPLPTITLLLIAFFNLLYIALTLWRLGFTVYPVTHSEFFLQLLIDVLSLSSLLYFTGGYTNPLVTVYLVLITTGAALLPPKRSWLLTFVAISAYTLLMKWYHPLGAEMHYDLSGNHQQMVDLHLLGMWFTFVISAVLINHFVVMMAATIRKQQDDIAKNREHQLRDETIFAIAIQAAGAAHELGTPLATMAVLLNDLQDEQNNSALLPDLNLLRSQVHECKKRLSQLVWDSQQTEAESIMVNDFLQRILDQWQLVRPNIAVEFVPPDWTEPPVIDADLSLSQAIIALLDNAADASPRYVKLSAAYNHHQIILHIDDLGSGIPDAITRLPTAVMDSDQDSGNHSGMGLGLLLSRASIERLGGQVRLYNRNPVGVRTEILLPARV